MTGFTDFNDTFTLKLRCRHHIYPHRITLAVTPIGRNYIGLNIIYKIKRFHCFHIMHIFVTANIAVIFQI